MTQDKVKKADLSVDLLDASDYNPNRMTEEEFRELVAEVGHLGRPAKPIIVRPNCGRYTIVDGEHNWRAACEVGIREVPCEIMDIDQFEAMRQTWKRNLRGTPDTLRTGKMFAKMLEQRKISQRELAKAINVSEATIRNHLNYAKVRELWGSFMEERAKDVRRMVSGAEEAGLLENVETVESRTASDAADIAVSALSARQVRLCLHLPEALRALWLAAGMPMGVLPKHCKGSRVSKELQALCSCDLLYGIVDVPGEFDESLRRALQFLNARDNLGDFQDRDAYLGVACRFRYSAEVMECLPLQLLDGRYTPVLSLEEWADTLERGSGLPSPKHRHRCVALKVRGKLKRKQLDEDALRTPGELYDDNRLSAAPDFLRDSLLLTRDQKLNLLRNCRRDRITGEEDLDSLRRSCSVMEILCAHKSGAQVPIPARK